MKRILFGTILLNLISTTLLAQSSPEITSLAPTTNGVSLIWTNPVPDLVYTVQSRALLSSGVWTNAAMRYRWPIKATNWTDAPSKASSRFYRILAETQTPPNRGRLISETALEMVSTKQLRDLFSAWVKSVDFDGKPTDGTFQVKFPVANTKFTYETVDPFGVTIMASALLILPQGATNSLPLIGVQHGTYMLKNQVPSQHQNSSPSQQVLEGHDEYLDGTAFATLGYTAVLPDYIGMGESPGYQAYHHAKTEASAVVDALRAARSICASNNVPLNGQLFLFGYSQGGHATVATHRELEAFYTNEFAVTAAVPCACAFNTDIQVQQLYLTNKNYDAPWVFPTLLASWLPIYRLGDTLEELLKPSFRRTIPPLMDGTHDEFQIFAAMPANALMIDILRSDYEADFRNNANNSLRRAFSDNSVYDWTPKVPVLILKCAGDTDGLQDVQFAYQNFTNRGACCVQLVDPGAPAKLSHLPCIVPALRTAIAWLETFRQ